MQDSPPFGQADLSNCERELIHLAGSIQPIGALLVVDERDAVVLQASANVGAVLGVAIERLLGRRIADLGGNLAAKLSAAFADAPSEGDRVVSFRCGIAPDGVERRLDALAHRHPGGGFVVELEALDPAHSPPGTIDMPHALLTEQLQLAVQRFTTAGSIGTLADAVVQCLHDLTGYDRVMVYKFDPVGHGKIIAEARDPRLESLLGHHYPATDIPQRARELYLRNRVRVLADVHYQAVPLVPSRLPTGAELDMSLCHMRSMSPLHLQYLKNMGVTATLVVSLVREGRLWGLIAAHHYSPRNLRAPMRAACELLGEVIATRIAAIENFARAQVSLLAKRLEQRLVEATSTEGDWRHALFRNPRTVLLPLEATGAALFHDGEILTTGEAPSTPELRALQQWIDEQTFEPPFACSSVGKANPALVSLTPVASGVIAVKLSTTRPDYLMWFRKEQLQTVTWAGDPSKPMVNDDPLELSPRRSFAAWSEIVRGTALPWSAAEIAMARAIGTALVDIVVQVHAVRMLIAEHQLVHIRGMIDNSSEPVAVADIDGRLLFGNTAFAQLRGQPAEAFERHQDVAGLFTEPDSLRRAFASLMKARQHWRGELALRGAGAEEVPVSVRVEVVPARDGTLLGFIVLLADLRETRRAAAARRHLEQTLQRAAHGTVTQAKRADLIGAILSSTTLAAMDIADGSEAGDATPLLQEIESATQRAAAIYERLRRYGDGTA